MWLEVDREKRSLVDGRGLLIGPLQVEGSEQGYMYIARTKMCPSCVLQEAIYEGANTA